MTKMIFSGFGGQGVLTLGQLVANIAVNQGKQVTWMPSYGVEMRGGTANCSVIISDSMIGSPIVQGGIDILCALNMPSITKFLPRMKPGGLLILNSSIVTEPIARDDVTVVAIDATNIAIGMGSPKVANMVMLAGFLKATSLFSLTEVEQVLEAAFREKSPEFIPLNIEAIKKGMSAS